LPTTVRVVCNNTLTMALAGPRRRNTLASGFTIRHTSGMRVALADVGKAYAQALDAHRDTKEAFAFLAGKPLKETMVRSFFNTVFAGPDESDRAKTIRQNREDALRRILASPTCNVTGTAGSALMLLHAAVEYVDHERTTRVHTGKSELESRLASAAFGSGADLKRKAWNTVLELAV
jgi:hypothetical protein